MPTSTSRRSSKHGTAWITFSNSHYDPVKGADLYNQYLDQLEKADELGFYGVCVNEHHQTAYGLMPTPGVLAGALARSVKKGKIAVLGRALPLVNNPLVIAEEFAMLDNLTRGRFIAGFVRGIGAEYHTMGINPAESLERFNEAHDLIIQAWTQAGAVRVPGQALQFQVREPVADALPEAASGDLHPLVGLAADDQVGGASSATPIARRWRRSPASPRRSTCSGKEAEKAGYEASPDQLAWSNAIFIGETDAKAIEACRDHMETYANDFLSRGPRGDDRRRAIPAWSRSSACARCARIAARSSAPRT